MNLSKKSRAIAETAIEAVLGLAAATPVLLMSTGVSSKVGAGAVVLAVSVGVTNLAQVPAVERFLDRMLGTSGNTQPFTQLVEELHAVETVLGEHVALHGATSSTSDVAVVASAPEALTPPTAASPEPSASSTPSGEQTTP
jgi:hypothetical protein